MDILNLEKKWSIEHWVDENEIIMLYFISRSRFDKYILIIETIFFFWSVILWFVFNVYICYFIILNIINTDVRSFIILLQYFVISKNLSIRNFSLNVNYVVARFNVINLHNLSL